MVFAVLVPEALLEIVQQFLGGQPLQLFFVHTQGVCHFAGVFEPLLQQGPGHFVNIQPLQIGQFDPLEGVGKHLVEAVEIALAFHQDRPAGRVKIVQRSDQTGLERAVQC